MVAHGSYSYGEQRITHIELESVYCTRKSTLILCVNYTKIKKQMKTDVVLFNIGASNKNHIKLVVVFQLENLVM